PMIHVMMIGVARGGERAHLERADANYFVVLNAPDAIGRHRRDATPEFFHLVAEDARGGVDQLGGIDQMLRAAGMHVDRGSQFGETPGCAGVIEMNVTEEDVTNIRGGKTDFAKIRNYIVEG